ncbi:Pex12 amino terminal region-domain-containing protein [Auriculariales sp. MPI-PUGE-AT-0066]|nr:Pex12 amino terminal region-domain-containing protein [Auriculariales sp. MPI-PUGE-AT-0066]
MEYFQDLANNSARPSLFEVIAQEQLRDLLQPALKYVLSVLAQRNPRYLLRIVNRHEEFYALIMLYVEQHFLRTKGASFAEDFYGLKRRRTPAIETVRSDIAMGPDAGASKLRPRDIRTSLLFLVLVPYLRAKAQDYYEALGGGVDQDILHQSSVARRAATEQTLAARLKRLFKSAYPYANVSYEVWLLWWNIAYLFDRTPYYRPWLAWMRVDLRRAGPEIVSIATAHPPLSKLARIQQLFKRTPRLLLDSLRVALPLAIFFVRFLEWWYSPQSPARALSVPQQGPVVPPPALLPPHPQGVPFDPTAYGVCPLCQRQLANATALPSGYVYCYTCLHAHVEKRGTCPVTLMPADLSQLRKILV